MENKSNIIRNSSSGFTLLEVLVTLAIAAMLTVIAVPGMTSLIASSRQSSGMTELLVTMNIARSEALKRHRHVTVCKSANGTSCGGSGVTWHDGWIVFENISSASVDQHDTGEEILHVAPSLGGNATIETNIATANFVSFRPSGRSNTAGLFTWCDSRGAESARGLILLPSGFSQVLRTQVNGDALSCGS